ncbi:MAG: ABC transporter ATP-binding protein [Chloroflexota bacterium]|nr:ABC transporter ATP-binding protein [Chloroflexota bacterium]
MSEVILRTESLYFRYPTRQEYALRDVNVDIHEGEFVALIGQNGSGKTTLIKHFNGLLRPDQGKVYVGGCDTEGVPTSELAREVGYVFQNPDHQIFADKVRDEVAFGPKNLGFDEERIQQVTERVLKNIGLEDYLDEMPFMLGKGQRQRLAVASVLAMEPNILIIDEPTTGQDWRECIQLMELIKPLNARGHTVLMTTHNMNLASLYARRAIVMWQGKIWMDGSVQEVFSEPEKLQVAYIKPPMLYQLAHRFCPNTDISRIVTPQDLTDLLYDQMIQACHPAAEEI